MPGCETFSFYGDRDYIFTVVYLARIWLKSIFLERTSAKLQVQYHMDIPIEGD